MDAHDIMTRSRLLSRGVLGAACLLLVHVVLGVHAATRLSPVWDEIVVPAAGLVQWRTGRADFNAEHPFLSKLILSLPLVFTSAVLPWDDPSWRAGDAANFGFQFTFRKNENPRALILRSRLAALACSTGLAIVLFLWGRRRWGPGRGLALMGLFLSVPIFRSRSSLALLEMPQYLFLGTGFVLWDLWKREGKRGAFIGAILCAAGSLLCKSSSLPFWAGIAVAELVAGEGGWKKRLGFGALFGGGVAVAVLLAYLPWGGGLGALKTALHFPSTFGATHNHYYFAGGPMVDAPAFLSWVAFFLKAPLFVSLVCLGGAWAWGRTRLERPLFWRAGLAAVVPFAAVLWMPVAVSTVQLSAAYLGLIVLGAGGSWDPRAGWRRWGAVLLGAGIVVEVALSHPNTLAYFNPLVGGARHGARWLSDSDQDWGQSLPGLKSYMEKNGNPGLLLAYAGAADPGAYGLVYQDVFSPALVSRGRWNALIPEGQSRVVLALSTKVRQVAPALGAWLDDRGVPKTIVDHCFHVYDVSARADVFEWLAGLYDLTRRPREAAWSRARARALSKETL